MPSAQVCTIKALHAPSICSLLIPNVLIDVHVFLVCSKVLRRWRLVLPVGGMVLITTCRVHRTAEVVASSLRLHRHLVISVADVRCETVLFALRVGGGKEVGDEGEDVEDVDERDDPLDDRGVVVTFLSTQDGKCDSECDLNDDEAELDPKAGAQDAVLAVVDSEALVFSADEDGRDDVTDAACRSAS